MARKVHPSRFRRFFRYRFSQGMIVVNKGLDLFSTPLSAAFIGPTKTKVALGMIALIGLSPILLTYALVSALSLGVYSVAAASLDLIRDNKAILPFYQPKQRSFWQRHKPKIKSAAWLMLGLGGLAAAISIMATGIGAPIVLLFLGTCLSFGAIALGATYAYDAKHPPAITTYQPNQNPINSSSLDFAPKPIIYSHAKSIDSVVKHDELAPPKPKTARLI